jgi:hypothetical protein
MAEPTTPPCGTCAGAREGPGPCPVCGDTGKRQPRWRLPLHAGPTPPPDWDALDLEEALAGAPDPPWLQDDADAATQLDDSLGARLDEAEHERLRRLWSDA